MYTHRLCECHTWNVPLLRQDRTWGSEYTPVSTPHLVADCLREVQIKAIVSWSEHHWFRRVFYTVLAQHLIHTILNSGCVNTSLSNSHTERYFKWLTVQGRRTGYKHQQPSSISRHNICSCLADNEKKIQQNTQTDTLTLLTRPSWHM